MSKPDDDINWGRTTWAGSRREQLRRCQRRTLRQRSEALDEMCTLARRLHQARTMGRLAGPGADSDGEPASRAP